MTAPVPSATLTATAATTVADSTATTSGTLLPPYPATAFPFNPQIYPETTYNDFKSGKANGGNYGDFVQAIPHFFAANTYDQFREFSLWWQSGTKAAVSLGLWSWIGWLWEHYGLSPAQVSDPLQGAEVNTLPIAGRAAALAAYNAERTRLGKSTTTIAAVTAPIAAPAPATSPVVRKSIFYDFVLKDGPGPTWQEKAETIVDTMTDGTVRTYPWTPFTQWTTPAELKAKYAGSLIPVTVRVRFWSEVPAAEQAIIEAAAPSTYTNPTPIPPPAPTGNTDPDTVAIPAPYPFGGPVPMPISPSLPGGNSSFLPPSPAPTGPTVDSAAPVAAPETAAMVPGTVGGMSLQALAGFGLIVLALIFLARKKGG